MSNERGGDVRHRSDKIGAIELRTVVYEVFGIRIVEGR